MTSSYETEDGEPRYGRRLPPEELAAYLREQGIEPPAGSESAVVPRAGTAAADDPYPRRPGAAAPRRSRGRGAAGGKAPGRTHRWCALGVGLVLMLVAAPLLLVAGVLAVVDGSLAQGSPLGADGVVYLNAGTTTGLYGTFTTATADCTITDSDGVAIIADTPEEGVPYAVFTAPQTGPYTVTCSAGTVGLVVGPPMNLDRIPLAAAAVLGAGVVGVAGLVTTIVGVARARR